MTSKTQLLYLQQPKICLHCNEAIPYLKRANKFCSHSCSASAVNKTRVIEHNPTWNRVKKPCLTCGVLHLEQVYCSRKCRHQFVVDKFTRGEVSDRGTLRNLLKGLRGETCEECGLDEWRGFNLTLEVDHIDGDASNNLPTNLRLICPNCHCITPSWKGRNKGKGRKSRGLPTH